MISDQVLTRLPALAEQFQGQEPFRHVVIDGFLQSDVAAGLLAEFPDFNPAKAIDENGQVGRKAVNEQIRQLGPRYSKLDQLIQSRQFLGLVSAITGIPDLLYDPYYFGGGTHDNRDGQSLDAHVDFNRHPVTHTHRRLNLIIYLNPDWRAAWGGLLELHSDPHASDDQITQVVPLFNRAVIFETTECSWHGFSPIRLPAGRQDEARRSIALYFYSTERPAEELAATHSTVYVDRPLPGHIAAGRTLSQADVDELQDLLQARDQHIQRLYRDTKQLNSQLEHALQSVGLIRGSLVFRSVAAIRKRLRSLKRPPPGPTIA
jgi:Rps23 Pro-64 3,4-dihydroxylase Tpa1-like proline 4-hydroxylase